MSPANEPRLSKAERTAQAREQARKIREEQLKKEKRNKLLIGWGIVVAVVAILVIIALVVVQNIQNSAPIADSGPTPANGNVHGGVTLLANNEVVKSEPATVNVADVPAPLTTKPATVAAPGAEAEAGKPVKVVAYIDFICPVCKRFETTYGESLTNLRNEGKISLEYRPLGFLDQQSTTNYSSRAANAAACVVNTSPEKYADFFNLLFERQPSEGGAGISDKDLKAMATEVGAANIDSCVDNKEFRPYVKVATQEAAAIGITGTPTVFVDGKQWDGSTDLNAEIQAAISAKG
ncbi:thioredoxin domain-containing protein [Arthrobacter sp. TES]|jgi:protein-disulfide isomerase|uniref:DsbA family protein n=1 Tax=Paenarthrobacter ureafaciens TaxID=37931 RepID=A0AAX3EN96_PAEUR|nr:MULTISPECIES: thioredoxin domain-containing protein [Paenarthrobacter]AMB39454.1 disulfide bond formation protein DsbA [Arthrobacter sp. ATCC 21022]AOY72623.1 DSBA oxidoreductase [Arthrobacter sp. ZXY-2]ERI36347.1 DSBA oxidoreductase [Arthrobacter sp. AK-YN10]NKR11252.1 disulfide bond formation protein DsbA [Arthrobacter sp. M5]NKR15154.1 disulfide bond formation protein DsbA [Arthrobacter sp. M6]OEH57192.1 disulfide bond formation protein DsbA [Arthrobacter sp. D4]OEH57730.1 disulfide bo